MVGKYKNDNQRKAMMARLRQAGFTPLSAKFMCVKAGGIRQPTSDNRQPRIYRHKHWGLLETDKTKEELDKGYGKGWKIVR